MLEHGGRLIAASRRYGIAPEQWLDVSTGINPLGWPIPQIPADLWRRLPEEEDGLVDAARRYLDAGHVLPVAGTQAAIQALPTLRPESKVGVLSPAYAEHGHSWRKSGHSVTDWNQDMSIDGLDVLVVVNPNNPTGQRFSRSRLLAWHQELVRRDGWLVVDEAYIDPTPEHSIAAHCAEPGLIVLRSLGKFFGLPGARVGFVLAEHGFLLRLQSLLGPWGVPGPSRWLAQQALLDTTWQQTQRDHLAARGRRLEALLKGHGLAPSGGTALFQWVQFPEAAALHARLAAQGILTRLFDQPQSLRFGLPGGDAEWDRLDRGLKASV